MVESRQNFLKGINRRFSRKDSVNPEFFYTLQNARLFNRGETGKVQRIDGYDQFSALQVTNPTVLDFIEFQEQYIVLFEDGDNAGTFYVEVFNDEGTSVYSSSYSGVDKSQGKLTPSDDTIFIAPHNKVIYYDGGDWILEDFISNVPTISGQNTVDGNDGKASATFQPTSGVSTTNLSISSRAKIKIQANNTIVDNPDTFSVSVGANTTDDITINYQMTEEEIAQEIYYALRGEEGYSDQGIDSDWDISLVEDQLSTFDGNSKTLYLTATAGGSTRNSDEITINGSDYNIVGQGEQIADIIHLTDGERVVSRTSGGSSTILISQPSGGVDSGSATIGPIYIRINSLGFTIKTENILSTDSANDIASKVHTALDDADFVTKDYDVFLNTGTTPNTVEVDAKDFGKRFNGDWTFKIFGERPKNLSAVVDYTKTNFTGGEEVDDTLTLESYTDYWYKARYKYIDGHVSEDCFPIKIFTGPSRATSIDFDTSDRDLDGSRPKLQVFRKKEGGNFFLIDEVQIDGDTHTYVDDGELILEPFEEAGLIWTKSHKTQTILDDRYVRANIEFFKDEYTEPSPSDFSLALEDVTGEETLPNNSKAKYYIQPQYEDGSKGYFEEIGSLDITQTGKQPTIQQNNPMVNDDKTIEEIGLFANYTPHAGEFITEFNSFELANPNVPTIEDSGFYPQTTRIFLGFKYLEVTESDLGVIKVAGWDSSGVDRDHRGFVFDELENNGPIGGRFAREISVNVGGIEFNYVRYAYRDAGNQGERAIYKLSNFEAIKKAASTGDLRVRMKNSEVGNLSTTRPDEELFGTEVKVKSIIDTSAQYDDLKIYEDADGHDILVGAPDTRLYLELEQSIYDEIDNKNLSKYNFKTDYLDGYDFVKNILLSFATKSDVTGFTMSWEFTNFKELSSATFVEYTGDGADNDGGRPESGDYGLDYYLYEWDYDKYELTGLTYLDETDTLVFIGRKENEEDVSAESYPFTGLELIDDEVLSYARLVESNIYSNIIDKHELNLDKTEFKNQLIWSDKLRRVDGFSGGRTFRNESFFTIGNENGEIIDIVSLGNKLYVFCERGIAVINVGEVLTTQKGGEVFVDSSTFMTNDYWITENMIEVKKESIVKFKNRIFFTDGYDVYSLSSQGFKNLSNGVIDLDPENEFYAGINTKHNEYQLCDYTNTETWIFNLEFEQWYGPFTYRFKNASHLKNTFITADDALYEHGIGNTFNGTAFDTILQSVANDTEESFYDKRFRKFYIESENDDTATFKYGKDLPVQQSKLISNMRVRNGYKHQGIHPDENNGKNIFWEIVSQDEGFGLSDISWRFKAKKRR